MNGYQLFVLAGSPDRVAEIISAYVRQVGSQAQVSFDSDKPSATLQKRKRRTFVISTPQNGYATIWEDGSWADKRLAAELSEKLATEAIWLMVSGATDRWAYLVYRDGKRIDGEMHASAEYLSEAQQFSKKRKLPFALSFFEDPNAEDDFENFMTAMKAKKGAGSIYNKMEADSSRPKKLQTLTQLPAGSVSKAMRDQFKDFLELTIPTTSNSPKPSVAMAKSKRPTKKVRGK